MSHYQNQYGAPAQQTDEYGNPIRTQGTMGDYGTGAYPAGPGVTDTGLGGDQAGYGTGGEHHGMSGAGGGMGSVLGGVLGGGQHGTGGMGGGGQHHGLSGMVKDEIAERMPGGGHKGGYGSGATTTPGGQAGYVGGEHHEKKGIIGKIKEKLPGGHH